MINVAFGSNFDAPVHDALEKGIEVLDSGCGKNEFECLYWKNETSNSIH